MKRFLNSKVTALLAFLLIIIVLVVTFSLRSAWWSFIDIFFFFMAAFAHLVATLLSSRSPAESKTLDRFAFWALVLGVIAFLAEFIIYQL